MDSGWTTLAKITDGDGDTLEVERRTRDTAGAEGLLFTTTHPAGAILTRHDALVLIAALTDWLVHGGDA